jgi:hypothetical protein
LFTSNGYLKSYSEEILPDQTVLFISEWERALGIPDGCFKGAGTLNERRRDVLTKLAALGLQTEKDFEDIAKIFDLTVDVIPGEESGLVLSKPKFTIVIKWFADGEAQSDQIFIMTCLYEATKPANVDLAYINLKRYAQCDEDLMQCGELFAECGNSEFF